MGHEGMGVKAIPRIAYIHQYQSLSYLLDKSHLKTMQIYAKYNVAQL
jgi:hypothetical protein